MKDLIKALSAFNAADGVCRNLDLTNGSATPMQMEEAVSRKQRAVADLEIALRSYVDARIKMS